MNDKIKKKESFTNLNVWKEAHKLALMICKITNKIQNSNKGFTIIEMIIAISVFSVMMLVVTSFFVTLYREQGADIARIQSTKMAGRAIDNINGEIRKMNRAENGAFSLESAQAQTLIFYSDVDNDGLTEKIEYTLNGIDFERELTEPGASLDYSVAPIMTIVAKNVMNGANPIFRYYDKNYTGSEDSLSSPVNVTEVRLIEISLDINTDEKYLSSSIRIETKIQPRNLRSFN